MFRQSTLYKGKLDRRETQLGKKINACLKADGELHRLKNPKEEQEEHKEAIKNTGLRNVNKPW